MQFWDKSQTWKHLASLGIAMEHEIPVTATGWSCSEVQIPKESRKQNDLSKFVISSMEPFNGCIFSVTESGVWAEEHNPVIIERIRLSYGEARSLQNLPTFVFEAQEREEAIALLRLFLMFCWDGYMVNNAGSVLFMLYGHEDFAYHCERNAND